jgi:CheY-like chemotaxis protein
MKILMVDDDKALLSFFAKELETRRFETYQSVNGDEALHVWQQLGPWEFVLTAYRFMPGTTIKNGVQLVTAIHGINPFQRMAIMTATPTEARGTLPEALRHLPVLRKPFRIEQVLRLLRKPVSPLS